MYSPFGNALAFSAQGVEKMRISNEGIEMVEDIPAIQFQVTSITSTTVRWLRHDSLGNTLTNSSDPNVIWPAVNYDRIVYQYSGSNGQCDAGIYIETVSGSYRQVGRSLIYGSYCAIVPAGKRFQMSVQGGSSGSSDSMYTIYRFGKV